MPISCVNDTAGRGWTGDKRGLIEEEGARAAFERAGVSVGHERAAAKFIPLDEPPGGATLAALSAQGGTSRSGAVSLTKQPPGGGN